jgi:hypothetical protein
MVGQGWAWAAGQGGPAWPALEACPADALLNEGQRSVLCACW